MSWGGSKDNDSKVFPVKDRQKQRFLGWGEALGTRFGGGGGVSGERVLVARCP